LSGIVTTTSAVSAAVAVAAIAVAVAVAITGAITVAITAVATPSSCGATKCERLTGIPVVAIGDIESIILNNKTRTLFIPWLEREGTGAAIECKEL
jgi:hypothetical protein